MSGEEGRKGKSEDIRRETERGGKKGASLGEGK